MIVKNLFVLVIVLPFFSYSQDTSFVSSGKPFATIYANFHKGITGAAKDESAFELVRGYLGYEYNFSPGFYAKINLDVGSPDDLSPYEKARRYAYFKNAYLRYMYKGLTIDFGLIDMRQFKLQESVWERRYLMKTLADEYQLGQSADLGMNVNYISPFRMAKDTVVFKWTIFLNTALALRLHCQKILYGAFFTNSPKRTSPKIRLHFLPRTITVKYGMLQAKWYCGITTNGRRITIF
jgi:hypothetical protein